MKNQNLKAEQSRMNKEAIDWIESDRKRRQAEPSEIKIRRNFFLVFFAMTATATALFLFGVI